MKNALIAAIVAAVVASGTTYAATRISGRAIKLHSIPANRLTPAAVNTFSSTSSPRALAAAVNSTVDYEQQTVTAVSGSVTNATATCPVGDVAIGGGYDMVAGNALKSYLTPDDTGWQVEVGDAPADAQITVYVVCEPTSP